MTNKYVHAIKQLEIDMNNGSLEAAHTLCAEMWNEIVENGYKCKHDSIVVKYTNIYASCAYCAFKEACEHPDWPDSVCPLLSTDNGCELYYIWLDATTKEERRPHALTIADIACSAE